MSAADVGDPDAGFEFLDDAVERRQPVRDQRSVVTGSEEAFAALEHVVVVLMPADAVTASRHLRDSWRVDDRAQRDLEEAGQIGRALIVGQRRRLLGREGVAPARRVVVDIPARCLGVEPLPHVSLTDVAASRQLDGRHRARVGQGPVEAELVPHHDERRVQGRSHLVDCTEDELFELVGVELQRLFGGGHRLLLQVGFGDRRNARRPSHQGGT